MSRWRDEDDVRNRPSRRNAPRRSKDQPTYSDANPALVVGIDRGRITCALGDNPAHCVSAVKARALGRKGVVVGDRVRLVGDTSGDEGTLARIVACDERTTTLRRTADDVEADERVVVANADLLVIVAAVADPQPRPRLIDRYLVAAYCAGMTPLLVLTKTDLADPAEIAGYYAPLSVEVFTTAPDEVPEALRQRLAGHVSVLVGHSGVGKSTLLNALVPSAQQRTGGVNVVTGRGRHTTTSSSALAYPGGGWLIDTPGIRSFGLGHAHVDDVLAAFPELAHAAEHCPRGCTHDEPECSLDSFVESGALGTHGGQVLDSLRRLIRSLGAGA